MNRSWPPNPRDAKHRQFHGDRAWNTVPVTILLMAVSLMTCFFTKVGEESERADLLFFRSQDARWELQAEWVALNDDWRALDLESGDDGATAEAKAASARLEERAMRIQEAMQRLDSKADALADIRSGQVWRLFTPMFMHFGYMHIIFNMWWLWSLGALIEIRYRPGRYLLLVLGVALVSNLAQAMLAGTNFGGMSGVNYGLFGFLFLHGRFHPSPSFRLDRQTIVFMLAWLVLCFTGVFGPIANWAHTVGFLAGAGTGFTQAMLAGGAKHIKRRSEFRRAVSDAKADTLHQCAVCAITELDDRDAEFRVGDDGAEYCIKHLPTKTPGQAR
jgi:membrane associated rhomboid family serine protease